MTPTEARQRPSLGLWTAPKNHGTVACVAGAHEFVVGAASVSRWNGLPRNSGHLSYKTLHDVAGAGATSELLVRAWSLMPPAAVPRPMCTSPHSGRRFATISVGRSALLKAALLQSPPENGPERRHAALTTNIYASASTPVPLAAVLRPPCVLRRAYASPRRALRAA